MIISASRRTDVPALYSEWFVNRIRSGWCLVPNPMNRSQVSRVSLAPGDVDAIVFWSKNPAPMLPNLDELDARGFRYYFQYALNDYLPELEPGIPGIEERVKTFRDLSDRLGPGRVVWRYDPIIVSNITSSDYHRAAFSRLARELRGATCRVMVSIIHMYRKTRRHLQALEDSGYSFDWEAASSGELPRLLQDLAATAEENGMEMFTCASQQDRSDIGVPPGRCVDEKLLNGLWSLGLRFGKDPSQRPACLCSISKDIGVSDTCIHACPYCYSTRSREMAERRHAEHDPGSPALWGDFG